MKREKMKKKKIAKKLAAKSPAFQRAYLGGLPYNYAKVGNFEKYCQILTDFHFLEAKIQHQEFGVQRLIEDYDLLREAEVSAHPEYRAEKVKALQLIQGALRLSAHVLAEDKTQLVEQLWGRMQHFQLLEIQALLSQAKQSKTTWLRPLTPSLTPPGGPLLRTLEGHSNFVNAVAVTADGQRAISGSYDKTLKVWNLETGELQFTLEGHRDWVNAVAVTADGKRAISGSGDNTLKVWNLETGELQFTLEGHSDWVNAVAVTADGKRAISGSWDKTLKVWDLSSGEVIASFTGESDIRSCAVAPDGVTIVAGEVSGRVHFLRLEGMDISP
jgi:predicted NACHT family NTPase